MFKKTIICLCLVMWLSPLNWAANQDALRYVDDLVYGVIRLDTKTADFSGSLDALLNLAGQTLEPRQADHLKQAVAQSRQIMEEDLATFQQAGGREIYAIFNLRDTPLFSLSFPVDAGVDAEGLKFAIEKVIEHSFNIDDLVVESQEKLIWVVKRPILDAMKTTQVTKNPLWANLLDQEPLRPFQIVVVPNEMQLRVLREMWPAMPGMAGMEQFKTMLLQCRWMTIGAQIVPEMAFEVSLEMQSEEMANQAVAFGKVMIPFIADALDIDVSVLNTIPIESHGQQVTCSVHQRQAQQILGRLILNPVQQLIAHNQQMTCARNVRDLGLALLMYADDHKRQLPASLEILKQAGEVDEKVLICPSVNKDTSYGYCGDGLDTKCGPDLIVVYDKKDNHIDSFRNVFFLDGHLEWVTPEYFQELKEKVNVAREERGLPPHIFE